MLGNRSTAQGGIVVLRVCLLVTSLAAIVYGILSGEAEAVLAKGIRICLECIGIA